MRWPLGSCLLSGSSSSSGSSSTSWRRAARTKKILTEVNQLLAEQKIDEAMEVCQESDSPAANILFAGLERRHEGTDRVMKAIENQGLLELSKLEKGLVVLATLMNVAPLLGFLGTVIGMIIAFQAIEVAGEVEATLVAGGIKVALLTTAAGLAIAIPVSIAHNYFVSRIDSLVIDMEESAQKMIDTLHAMEPAADPGGKTDGAPRGRSDVIAVERGRPGCRGGPLPFLPLTVHSLRAFPADEPSLPPPHPPVDPWATFPKDPPTALPDRRVRPDLPGLLRLREPAPDELEGENTSAPWGFANFLLRIREEYQPDYLAVVFDAGMSQREELYPEYKATREKMPDELEAVAPPHPGAGRGLHDVVVELDGYEADDVIGTLAEGGRGGARGGDRLRRQGFLPAHRARACTC
jgi:biopolymer transport protein ExbB